MLGALVIGIALAATGAVHCSAMCGPLALAQCRRGRGSQAAYQLGRIIGYSTLGALAGVGGQHVGAQLGPGSGAVISWLLAAALLLWAYRMWKSEDGAGSQLLPLRRRPNPSLVQRIRHRLGRGSLLFGAATSLLPCGLLWAAFALSAGSGSAVLGATTMFGFAVTSGGVLVAAAWIAREFGRRIPRGRRLLAIAMVTGAVVIAMRPIHSLRAETADPAPSCHSEGARAQP